MEDMFSEIERSIIDWKPLLGTQIQHLKI